MPRQMVQTNHRVLGSDEFLNGNVQVREGGQPLLDACNVIGVAVCLIEMRGGHAVANKMIGQEFMCQLRVAFVVGLLEVAAD